MNIQYNHCESLLVNIIDNKKYRNTENLDNVLTYFLRKYNMRIKNNFLVNLVIRNLTESDKKMLDVTNTESKYYKMTRERIRRLTKKSNAQ